MRTGNDILLQFYEQNSEPYKGWDAVWDIVLPDGVTEYAFFCYAPDGKNLVADWGDGSGQEVFQMYHARSYVQLKSHTYPSSGQYRIKLKLQEEGVYGHLFIGEPNYKVGTAGDNILRPVKVLKIAYRIMARSKGDGTLNSYPQFAYGCTNLQSVVLAADITMLTAGSTAHVFCNCSSLRKINLKHVVNIGQKTFFNCSMLDIPELPENGLYEIGDSAFQQCASLTWISLPETVKNIGGGAFNACTGIRITKLPIRLHKLGVQAFRDVPGISIRTVPAGVHTFAGYALHSNVTPSLTFRGVPDALYNMSLSSISGLTDIYVPWKSTDPINALAPWGAPRTATVHYDIYEGYDIVWTIGCIGGELTYRFRARMRTGGAQNVYWGDGTSTMMSTPLAAYEHTYSSPGEYIIKIADASKVSAFYPNEGSSEQACRKYGSMITGVVKYSQSANSLFSFQYCSNMFFSHYAAQDLTQIDSHAFQACSDMVSFNLPSTVTSIGNYAFRECTGLTSIDVPACTLGPSIFYHCTALRTVTLAEGITGIPNNMFDTCKALTTVSIPSTVTAIGNNAFSGCTVVNMPELSDTVLSLGIGAFRSCNYLAWTALPSGLTEIPASCFSGGQHLALTSLPDGVLSIGESAFSSCSVLMLTHLPDSITRIGKQAFYKCNKNAVIDNFPQSCTYLGDSAFYGVTFGPVIDFPACLDYIGSMALQNLKLYIVRFHGKPSYMANNVFYADTTITDIYVPWSAGEVAGAPWGANRNATVHYDTVYA